MINYRENTVGLVCVDEHAGANLFYRVVKRTFDFFSSLTALALLSVPMLLIALIVRIDSKGSPVFKQKRVGRDGQLFYIYKFRTMVTSAPSETATHELEEPYSYITRVGAFLRKTSLDELPQLLNVLKGDMSIVGPRPLIAAETTIHRLRNVAHVYTVRPGMTGWAQINGRDNLTDEEKVRLDGEYVRRRSISFDVQVLLKTIAVVVTSDGYAEGAQQSNRSRRRKAVVEKLDDKRTAETQTPDEMTEDARISA